MRIIILILMFLNRINLSILKGYFLRTALKRVRWYNSDSIINGMTIPCYQILEILLSTMTFFDIINYIAIFIYILISLPIINVLIFILSYFPFNKRKNHKKDTTIYHTYKTGGEFNYEESGLGDFDLFDVTTSESSDVVTIVDSYNPLFNESMNHHSRYSLNIENAGGASEISEAWSINYLMKMTDSEECYCESEILYDLKYKMVDYILINKKGSVGVSVVRAMTVFGMAFEFEDGIKLLRKKIEGLVICRKTVNRKNNFDRSILHIWSLNNNTTKVLLECINSKEFNSYELGINGIMDIWITESEYLPIFTNGNNSRIIKI